MWHTNGDGDKSSATREKAQAEENIASLGKQIADLKLEQLKAELEKPWTRAQTVRFQKYMQELKTMKAWSGEL